MFKKKYFITLVSVLMVLVMGGCASKTSSTSSTTSADTKETPAVVAPSTVKNTVKPVVTIVMEDGAKIKIELYPEVAPNTVNNFVSLVQKKFYDGLIFHRVIPGFMIQGGDKTGTGSGDLGYSIKGEFSENGVDNTLKHTKGVISMARTNDPDTAGSQFFIVAADSSNNSASLDGKYAAFGKVIEGMEEVDKIVSVDRDANDKPIKEQKMKTVTVDTLGGKFSEPEKVK